MGCCNLRKETNDIFLLKIIREIEKLSETTEARLLKQDGKIAELCIYIRENLSATITEYLDVMKENGSLDKIITDVVLSGLSIVEIKTEHIVNVKEFGAKGDGICDDFQSIQKAINYANTKGRKVFIPKGEYLISEPIVLNGCSIEGEPGNIFSGKGTILKCCTNDFTAIKQGSTNSADIMFNVSNIIVENAKIGFEFNYVINSEFKQLYAISCDIGFKLGDVGAVGSMFCKFNGLYTKECRIGIESLSKQYFNNNEFNNGFIYGEEYAMLLQVNGGYGAVGNVFNNVEFRSNNGRGIILDSTLNTVFNSCYFECGGNSIRGLDHSSITLNNCSYALFKKDNTHSDNNVIYAVGGFNLTINGGVIFLTENYNDIYFFASGNESTYNNVTVLKSISKNGSATNFKFFIKSVGGEVEQYVLTSTVNVESEQTTTVNFTYPTPFSKIPEVVIPVIRGANVGVISYMLTNKTESGGTIEVVNKSTVTKSISFSVYAKIL